MLRGLLVLFTSILSLSCLAQRQFPGNLSLDIDSIFNICYEPSTSGEEKIRLLQKVDDVLQPYEKDYPLFRGVVNLYEAYYAPNTVLRNQYRQNALGLLRYNTKVLADSFFIQFSELVMKYTDDKRFDEWTPVDSLLRHSLGAKTSDPNSYRLAVSNMAMRKLNTSLYEAAKSWGLYDMIFWDERPDTTLTAKTSTITYRWIVQKSKYEIWKQDTYYQRNENASFRKEFEDLIRRLNNNLSKDVTQQSANITRSNKDLRVFYFALYYRLVMDLADWAINDHREGIAILPLKEFIYRNAIKLELEPAAKADIDPVIPAWQMRDAFRKLAELYMNINNGNEAYSTADKGSDVIYDYKRYAEKDRTDAFYTLFYVLPEAKLAAGKYESALKLNNIRKRWYFRPATTDSLSIPYWNNYIDVRLTEAAILNAQNKIEEARKSLSLLLDSLSPIANDSVELLYDLYQWPHLQYAVQKQKGKTDDWETARGNMLDALTTLEQRNHWENVGYYYPAQLLYFIAHYRVKKIILKHVLYNMLFYTERHLKYTFIMLPPQDRMRLYEQKLNNFFDLYHELLFTHKLDSLPELKEKVITQSLFLKNALSDNNLLPDSIFAGLPSIQDLVASVRRSKMDVNMFAMHMRLTGNDDDVSDMDDNVQSLWLSMLKYVNTDSIYTANSWKKISAQLNSNQVYVEAVRYTSWLSDSSVNYGSYIINSGNKLDVVSLFKESPMVALIKDPSASPQNSSINSGNTRGLTIAKAKKEADARKFKPGDVDKLGQYIIAPLYKYISTKKELLIVPDALLNRISLPALQWQHKNLGQLVLIRQLSSSNSLFQPKAIFPVNAKALLAGGLDYGSTPEKITGFRLFDSTLSWKYLPGTQTEIDKLQPLFASSGSKTTVFNGGNLPDSSRAILEDYQLIHLATHGFYIDSSLAKSTYSKYTSKEAARQEPLLRCGIALSFANHPLKGKTESDGYLLGSELANTDLRKCYLISLSACETGLGDLRNNLGVDGLTRALKLGGARYLLISLWKVPDAPTAVFMQQFYKELFRLKDPAAALQSTQAFMSKQYSASDWAAFVLVE